MIEDFFFSLLEKGRDFTAKFIPRDKLSKKARKQLDAQQRTTWGFSPVTKKVESKKLYDRKKRSHARYDDGMRFFIP